MRLSRFSDEGAREGRICGAARWGTESAGQRVAKAWISLENCGTVALFVLPVGVARIARQFVLRSEQHGMFMAAHSANPVATSMEPITRTSSHVIVGLICSCGFLYTASPRTYRTRDLERAQASFRSSRPDRNCVPPCFTSTRRRTSFAYVLRYPSYLRRFQQPTCRKEADRHSIDVTDLHSRVCGPDDVDALQVRAEG